MKNLLIAQSGGPTAAINATLIGALTVAEISDGVDKVYGALNGIQGVLEERFIELNNITNDTMTMKALIHTPAAALGSCRFKLDKREQYEEIIAILRKYDISYFIYIGGNDSMDTVWKLSSYCEENGIDDIFIMGAPKTIDNDLEEIDHCPGFGSAAKYIATTFAELERDISVYCTEAVTIVEVMGRNSGWLTAASVLSRLNGNIGPSLIYLCESEFSNDQFIEDVKEKLKEHKGIIIAVSEGIKHANGKYVTEEMQSGTTDMFGHAAIAGAARYLERLVKEKIGCKVRSIELSLMQRASTHIASETDIMESRMLGMKALQCALEGKSGEMASIKRTSSDTYALQFLSVPIEKVANREKKVPASWINQRGNDVTDEMIQYLYPLIQGELNISYNKGIPQHLVLNSNKSQ